MSETDLFSTRVRRKRKNPSQSYPSSVNDVNDQQGTKAISHKKVWDTCTLCACSCPRKVHYKGSLPCDILFIGEAPSVSERSKGVPFVGPTGARLDKWIHEAQLCSKDFTYAITHMLACFPNQEGYKSKFRPPTDVEISNCFPRLLELLDLAQPKGIVLIGKLTDKLRKLKEFKDSPYSDLPFRKITHPSWSIREGKGDLDFHGISQLSSIAQLIREIG